MERDEIRGYVQGEVDDKIRTIAYLANESSLLVASPLDNLLGQIADSGAPVEDIYHVQHTEWSGQWRLIFSLKADRRDSTLVRDLVRFLGVPAAKKPSDYDSSTLEAVLDLNPSGLPVTVHVRGYLPETCRVEYEDVVVPEHVERKAKVVCSEPDADDTGEEVTPEEVP